ncbi:tRNA (adenosine(37)-N6)-threonylcarbamoyltransferase complex transferase subunit TsaD [Sulfurospirillum sp. 1612]|uniref:tRNA (adenosine(37)-N6)-threonylcarbamoyltransferase complex transferase subunit TsaD n=1 Tax=Sulfurospirillum sp. 1612 TaxID=3094835 RepID=UPI002F94AA8C
MILSIESSCDDSSIAITRICDGALLYHKKISQELDHSVYGGVVPELAARLHALALPKILEETKAYFPELKAIAVTNEPGLSVSLVEGIVMAKALSVALKLPILPINHLKGHIYSLFLEQKTQFPLDVLLVSGGHTQILHIDDYDHIYIMATTLDDSFGESFDKVSKMLGLGYPGGPIVEQYAKEGNAQAFNFTVPLSNSPKMAFSFSGLKNQVRLCIEAHTPMDDTLRADICASFQKVAIAHLMQKLNKVYKNKPLRHLGVVGGASANLSLRAELEKFVQSHDAQLHVAPLAYCSDNAAMIGRCAIDAYKLKRFVPMDQILAHPRSSEFIK